MRDLNISPSEFDTQLKELFLAENGNTSFLAEMKKDIDPKQQLETIHFEHPYKIIYNINNPELTRALAIRSWYFSEPELGYHLRSLIKYNLRKSSIDFVQRQRILPLLESKDMMINYLVDIDESISARDWYGNILKSLATVLDKLKIVKIENFRQPVKPEKYTGYCRGYRSSPKQESLVSNQSQKNEIFWQKWKMLKNYRIRLSELEDFATQLYILRDFKSYKILLSDLEKIRYSYNCLKEYFCMDESQIENVIEAEELHRSEGEKMLNYK